MLATATAFLVLPFAAVAHDDAIKDCESNLEALADIADVEDDGDDIITTTMHAMYCVVDLGA